MTVTGTLMRRTFPGPPNYASVRQGDRPETYWLLRLDESVCPDRAVGAQEERGPVRVLQMLFRDANDYRRYGILVGRRVAVTGPLVEAHTGHHKTPLLIQVEAVKRAP